MGDLIGQTLLNRYRVDAFIGHGGMADVYKVWDAQRATYLAMKLLHEELTEDMVFLRRFKREAQTLARLQHPNIVRYYGLEQDGARAFILMDFVEGRSLRKGIFEAGGPLSVEQVLAVMRPVCSALHYAHSKDMVHCDIKPANIMLHNNGVVLVTDFGIARMTESTTTTLVGAGTPAYMAPEQVRGEEPTPQTDIYALGVTLFEMLTGGERPFTGEHAQTTGSTSEKVRWEQAHLPSPSPRNWNPRVTPKLEAVVSRCLEKEPGKRYPCALDLLNALESATGYSPSSIKQTFVPNRATPQPVVPARLPARQYGLGLVVLGVALVLIALAGILILRSGFSSAATAPTLAPPPTAVPIVTRTNAPLRTLTPAVTSAFALPPATFLPTASRMSVPPTLTRAPTVTQPPARDATSTSGALPQIVFSSRRKGNIDLYIMNADGSSVTQLTNSAGDDDFAVVSPDGRRIVFNSNRDGNWEVYVMNRDGTDQTRLTFDGAEDRLPSWSPDGQKILFSSDREGNVQLHVMDADGKNVRRLTRNIRRDGHSGWSANGWMVFNSGDANNSDTWEIYIIRADGSNERRLTNNNVNDWSPNWSFDGRQIIFLSKRGGQNDPAVWAMDADGSNPHLVYNNSSAYEWGAVWSPDGRYVAFTSDVDGQDEIYLLRLSDSSVIRITYEGGMYPSWAP